ncbi:MAG: DUF2085 domain-containing protein [Anaerolineales bacterium]|nr:DUF2085 domain-containing protein [Anaerolineales bacterium]
MINVILYSRVDCHLCEQAEADLKSLQGDHPHNLVVIDVDSNPELRKAYGLEVPVVEVGPYKLKAPFDRQELGMTLGAAADRKQQIETYGGEVYQYNQAVAQRWTRSDGFSYWFARHYLAIFSLILILYAGIPFLAPVLMKIGATGPANVIYRGYGIVCHQLAYRSFFLFGEQVAYPRSAVGVPGLLTWGEASGISEDNQAQSLVQARQFVGSDLLGFKVALCQRDLAIYLSILLFIFLFSLTRRRLSSLHWLVWIILGLVPVGIDGLSQLLSQSPFNFLPFRESTPVLRLITGGLFGFMTAWFGIPMVEETMSEANRILAAKRLRVSNSEVQ